MNNFVRRWNRCDVIHHVYVIIFSYISDDAFYPED
jgi:hypothetical protein